MIFPFNWVIVRFQPWICRGVLREYLGQPNFGEIFTDGVDESNSEFHIPKSNRPPVSFKESTMLVYWSVGSSRSFFTGLLTLRWSYKNCKIRWQLRAMLVRPLKKMPMRRPWNWPNKSVIGNSAAFRFRKALKEPQLSNKKGEPFSCLRCNDNRDPTQIYGDYFINRHKPFKDI